MQISRIWTLVLGSLQLACSSTEPKVVEEGGVRVVHVQGEWLRKLPQARAWVELAFDSLSGDSTPKAITGGILLANGNVVVSNDATQTLEIHDASGRLTARLGGRDLGPRSIEAFTCYTAPIRTRLSLQIPFAKR